jgi:hypothetical protein
MAAGGTPFAAWLTALFFSTACGSEAATEDPDAATASGRSVAWYKVLGGPDADRAMGIAFAPSGDVIVVGGFRGEVDFGGGVLAGTEDESPFVARYRKSDGAYIAQHPTEEHGFDWGNTWAVAARDSGDIAVAGTADPTGGEGVGVDDIAVQLFSGPSD